MMSQIAEVRKAADDSGGDAEEVGTAQGWMDDSDSCGQHFGADGHQRCQAQGGMHNI